MRVKTNATNEVDYLLTDHLGSTTVSYRADGQETHTQSYKPWGELRGSGNSLPTDYTFTGQRSRMETLGLMFFNARWYDPALGRFAQADTIIPGAGNPLAWDRYAGLGNNPVRYTDPSGHRVTCEVGENCAQAQRLSRLTGERYWKALIKDDFGIIMSDEGDKPWDIRNLSLVYSSSQNINTSLNGRLKSMIAGSHFMLSEHVPDPENPDTLYGGLTSRKNVTFNTTGSQIVRQMNIYHEIGHLINNSNSQTFSGALDDLKKPSFINGKGVLDTNALKSERVYDPTYGHAQAIQHELTDPSEQWADIFANYVAGNIDVSQDNIPGTDMYNFVTDVLAP